MENYYKLDQSMSLNWMSVVTHNIRLLEGAAVTLHPGFQQALDLLPTEYDAESYRDLIDAFGTHYMTEAYMGGSALQVAFFDSCLLYECDGQWVSDSSSSSWCHMAGDYNSDTWGFEETNEFWTENSEVSLQLLGGDAWAYGDIGSARGTVLNETEFAAWQASLLPAKTIPVSFTLEPISNLVADANLQANIETAIEAFFVEVNETNVALTDDLMKQDPWVMPDWCTCASSNPHCTDAMCCTGSATGRQRRDWFQAAVLADDPFSCDGPQSGGQLRGGYNKKKAKSGAAPPSCPSTVSRRR